MNIEQACEAFRILLEEQQNRIANMNTEKTDFTTKKCVTIGIVDGDGIGPYTWMNRPAAWTSARSVRSTRS